jgi:iron complex transport system ATP-binding protein
MLRAADVSFVYPARRAAGGRQALDRVTLEIPAGSITGLLGPNGCGKTTLLKVLSGVLGPTHGSVTIDGRSLSGMSRREIARRIATVPQETHPAFDYSCLEMVLMGRHPHLGAFGLEGPEDVDKAVEAMRATGTALFADRRYGSLSGGEKQRVVIAMALAQAGSVMLLDEPTASLDLGYQLEVAALVRQLHQERATTFALATHDLNLAASLCDTLVCLRDGRVMAHGPTSDVLTRETIAALYDVEADVVPRSRAGHPVVVPLQRIRHDA